MAGLLAARVLAEHYRSVTVVDRDAVSQVRERHRRGVPQGRHVHGLHPRGLQVLEELLPGLTASLVAGGVPVGDPLGNMRWQLSGHQLRRAHCGLQGVFASRPFLEGRVRARVAALPGVHFAERADVVGLTATSDRRRVTGVRIHRHGAAAASTLNADLMVDATGRGSRAPLWLEALGYPRPAEERVRIDLGYATRHYRLPPGALGGDLAVLTAPTADRPRGAILAGIEGGRHTLTAFGMAGDHPPTDPAGFAAFVSTLAFDDIADAIRDAQPLDDPVAFRLPASVRRRYEELRRLPDRFLVIGDAVCSFNPVYGQGMTVAATQAATLRTLLDMGCAPAPRRYFRELAGVVDVPWDIAVGGDLALPAVPGKRTAKIRLINAYLARLHAAATAAPATATTPHPPAPAPRSARHA